MIAAAWLLLLVFLSAPALAEPRNGPYEPPSPDENPELHVASVCSLIEREALANALPAAFFARLIWKESRFDPNAVSPAGAEGIAQFMPGTATLRGLANSFDMHKAIPASAKYLAEMARNYGNLGLAAIGYNAGEGRLKRWMANGGFLPLETENYVQSILAEPADNFADPAHQANVAPLDAKLTFKEACKAMPVVFSQTISMAQIHTKPWGIQVAGNVRRDVALAQWQRVKARFADVLGDQEPVISRVRTGHGRAGINAVRIGAEDREQANLICSRLRKIGGACIVLRNR